jgi:hypothetical protein
MPWQCLTLKEQLNTMCDTLANSAVTHALTLGSQPIAPMLLPFEQVAVVVDGIKLHHKWHRLYDLLL